MIIARSLISRFVVGVVLVLGSFKLAVARIVLTASKSGASPTEPLSIKTSRIFHFFVPARNKDASYAHYGLEATGAFPYVRIIALQQHSAPVPVEVAPAPGVIRQREHLAGHHASAKQKQHPGMKKRSRPLTRRTQSNHEKPFCYPANSQSCLDCPCLGCITCTSCSSSAGCSSCGGNCTC